jgi:hypothetical protein
MFRVPSRLKAAPFGHSRGQIRFQNAGSAFLASIIPVESNALSLRSLRFPSVLPMAGCLAGMAGDGHKKLMKSKVIGGSGGIRTHGRVPPTLVFKTRALNHSATLPSEGATPRLSGRRLWVGLVTAFAAARPEWCGGEVCKMLWVGDPDCAHDADVIGSFPPSWRVTLSCWALDRYDGVKLGACNAGKGKARQQTARVHGA